jgi:hypothetical protein
MVIFPIYTCTQIYIPKPFWHQCSWNFCGMPWHTCHTNSKQLIFLHPGRGSGSPRNRSQDIIQPEIQQNTCKYISIEKIGQKEKQTSKIIMHASQQHYTKDCRRPLMTWRVLSIPEKTVCFRPNRMIRLWKASKDLVYSPSRLYALDRIVWSDYERPLMTWCASPSLRKLCLGVYWMMRLWKASRDKVLSGAKKTSL